MAARVTPAIFPFRSEIFKGLGIVGVPLQEPLARWRTYEHLKKSFEYFKNCFILGYIPNF